MPLGNERVGTSKCVLFAEVIKKTRRMLESISCEHRWKRDDVLVEERRRIVYSCNSVSEGKLSCPTGCSTYRSIPGINELQRRSIIKRPQQEE